MFITSTMVFNFQTHVQVSESVMKHSEVDVYLDKTTTPHTSKKTKYSFQIDDKTGCYSLTD